MPIFEASHRPHHWTPSALAAGPFAGLQGGAVASLLTAEIEAQAASRNWGTAISASAWFLRPTPMTDLRTQLSVVSEGGRVSVIDNTLWPADEDQPCATVRVTLSRERAVEIPGLPKSNLPNQVFLNQVCRPRQRGPRSHAVPDPHQARGAWQALVHGCHGSARRRWHRLVPARPCHHRRRRIAAADVGAGPGGLDPRHRAAGRERGGRPEPEPDRAVVQAAVRARGSAFAPKPGGVRRPASGSAAACCSTSTARSAGSRCR